ncbi:hypothetical protein [Modestobacter sp. Leaf380]|uniref:hypothetical protein n=1 Tax=Modestobacter sp. Leaf380 TaxID=1736356 RepID=UPI000700895D|nr:hypothetical protein [Modestobacter sp. Leaf380]KQS69239.1 hypothetical protein ASG41_21705 [Modestobacter sp. Leaf380]
MRFGFSVGISAIATATAIVINVATDFKHDWRAWAAVVLLTLVGGAVSYWARPRPETPPVPDTVPADIARAVTVWNISHVGRNVHVGNRIGLQGGPMVALVAIILVAVLVLYFFAGRDIGQVPAAAAADAPPGPRIDAQVADGNCGNYGWLAPGTLDDLVAAPPKGQDEGWLDWGPTTRGAAYSQMLLTLTIDAASDAQLVIDDISVRVVDRSAPLEGVAVAGACGSPSAYRFSTVDLAAENPILTPAGQDDFDPPPGAPAWALTPLTFPYEVSSTDAEEFAVHADLDDGTVTFELDVRWSSQGESGTETVLGPGGEPFRVTSGGASNTCDYSGGPVDVSLCS